MRALLPALALLATAAAAQDVRVIPLPESPDVTLRAPDLTVPGPADCSRGAALDMEMPEGARPLPALPLGGPRPVPMPNLCADGASAALADRLRQRPETFRFREDAPPGTIRRFRLDETPEGTGELRLRLDDLRRQLDEAAPPVAPPDGRE